MRAALLFATATAAACVSPVDYSGPPVTDAPADAPVDAEIPIFDATDGPPNDTPLANHDEDGDGVDDAIDTCPTVSSATHLDADLDGVGDDCDPQPGVANRIERFWSFKPDERAWISNGVVTWNLVNDALETSTLSANSGAYSPLTVDGAVKVVAKLTVVERTGNADVSLFDDYDLGMLQGAECYVAQTAAQAGGSLNSTLFFENARFDAETRTIGFAQVTLNPGQELELVAQHDRNTGTGTATMKRCTARIGPFSATVARLHGQANNNVNLRVAARNLRVRVHSVIAYSLTL